MSLTKEQKRAAYASGSVAVTAGAGTGKTHMLTERYLHFLRADQGFSPLQIVAVTFTDKAATELRSRIRQAVTKEMGDRLEVLANLEAAQISTFHSLATRICQEHPDRAHVPPDFVVQDAIAGALWQAEHFDRALAQLPADLYEAIPFSLMQAIMAALLSDPLTAEQALTRGRTDWLPTLETFRKTLLEGVLQKPEWSSACAALNLYSGPVEDKREVVRQQALAIASTFESTGDVSSLEALSELALRGGSKQKWPDPESFNGVGDAVKALKKIANESSTVLRALVPNEYDDQAEALLPAIREAFTLLRSFLQEIKYQQRILDFNDLEVHALKALQDPVVQRYYAQRWQVFLIDEFQDTNPTQGKLLELLTSDATLTIVGDQKQSIYGFRRADTAVFKQWQARIHSGNGAPVELSTSFRTHRSLMTQINQVFAPVLAEMHQPLEASRDEELEPTPEIQLYQVVVDEEQKENKALDTGIDACRLVEAQKIADLVQSMVDAKIQVQDKPSGQLRQIEPRDIAILGRTWGPLELYSNAISARGIPVLQAGGGSLLDTREAKDAISLLRFLADPTDSLALAALLRSPFFAVSDLTLYAFAQSLPERVFWWKHLREGSIPELENAIQVLTELLGARRVEAPTRLLQMCDRLTGYTAVITNLPGAARRMADWNGFIELVRSLEHGSFDVLAVLRQLKQVVTAKVTIPRPAVEGGNAVSLMTIHGSKGLEWPVVFVPDLSHSSSTDFPVIRFDAKLGVALKLSDESGDLQKSAFYTLLEQQKKMDEREEGKRVFYVALTRARDRLFLTSAGSDNSGGLKLLAPGFSEVLTSRIIPFDPQQAQPVEPAASDIPAIPAQRMVLSAQAGFSDLPVTALSDYALCPLRFKFRYVDGHPGYQTGTSPHQDAMALGRLMHKALELKIDSVEDLAKHDFQLPITAVQEALELAQKFHSAEVYRDYRQGNLRWEKKISLEVGGLTLNGVVDLVGDDFVLDFKSDQSIQPEHHQFQLWAYSQATGKANAYLAYLRHDHIHPFDTEVLKDLDHQFNQLVERLMNCDFAPQPEHYCHCRICPYAEICESKG